MDERLKALEDLLPPGTLVTDPDLIDGYRFDRSNAPHAGTPLAVVRANSTADVQVALRWASEYRVPVVPRGAGTGLAGGSLAIDGCITISTERMRGIEIDPLASVAVVQPGALNAEVKLAAKGFGLWYPPDPSSFEICSIGGNVATNAGGLCCVKYGVTTDHVLGIEVVLADGHALRLGGRAVKDVAGYDLKRLFIGSEGTLGIITEARLRIHPVAPAEDRRAWGFKDFAEGLDACRRILRRGATPAVLRLYDTVESERSFSDGAHAVLIVLDEADRLLLDATLAIVDAECKASGAEPLDEELVERWMGHRNDVSALAPLYRAGIVVDTVEVSGRWSILADLYSSCLNSLRAVEGTLVASAHQSHAYTDGACIYLTFAGRMPEGESSKDPDTWAESYYASAWQSVMDSVIGAGGTISHHHGIGINRSRFMGPALGKASLLLESIKGVLDPRGILNPGKLGIPAQFGEVGWP